ncbi:MAG: DUF2617 family protein [Candidatus Pacebacteria bacterium]|nr:DUF2617 family protein [Candidatus Paceibacterota bacterium]
MEEQLVFLDQTVHALRHHFVKGYLDTKSLSVVVSQKRNHCGFDIEAAIIGASHYISIETPAGLISEVVACIDIDDSTHSRCVTQPLHKLGHGSISPEKSGLVYTTCTPIVQEIEKSQEYIAWHTSMAQLNTKEVMGLLYEFPQGELNYPPRTAVVLEFTGDTCKVSTMHEYPNEGMVAFTKSKFQTLNFTQ